MLRVISDRERPISLICVYHLYMESKKYNKLVNKTKKKQTHRYREQTSGYQWGEVGRGKILVGDYKNGLDDVIKDE